MAQYEITAAFLVTTVDTLAGNAVDVGQVKAQAVAELQTAARRASWNGTEVTIHADDVTVTKRPEPETVTMTRTQLEAEIAACVAQALAQQNTDQQKG